MNSTQVVVYLAPRPGFEPGSRLSRHPIRISFVVSL